MNYSFLQLPGAMHIAPTRAQLYNDLAVVLLGSAASAVERRDVFHMALSGGSTPEPFYTELVIDPRYRGLPWQQTHIWLVDERRVPPDDEQSNFRMIRESLVDHLPIKQRQVHPMPVLADDPAGEYERELREVFELSPSDTPRMDFILLGMGDDCHTASLFPHSPAAQVRDRWVAVNEGEHVTPPSRLTLTFPTLNAGRYVAVLVSGAAKADALRQVSDQVQRRGPDASRVPISGVQPYDGELVWFLDNAAAGRG